MRLAQKDRGGEQVKWFVTHAERDDLNRWVLTISALQDETATHSPVTTIVGLVCNEFTVDSNEVLAIDGHPIGEVEEALERYEQDRVTDK